MFLGIVNDVYGEMETAVKGSIWVEGKLRGDRVSVRSRDLTHENEEGIGAFTGTLFRALRNTHHGYLSRLDPPNRPSRYLAMTSGNVPDSLQVLALVWVLALLADTPGVTGWIPLGFGTYD